MGYSNIFTKLSINRYYIIYLILLLIIICLYYILQITIDIGDNRITYNNIKYIIMRKPHTFNYFVNSLKFDRLDEKIKFADKYYARNYMNDYFPNINLIPLLYCTSTPSDLLKININSKCVIKASNGSGFNRYLTKINDENREELYNITKKWLNTNYRTSTLTKYTIFNEPQYARHIDVTRMIIVEQDMGELYNYKFHMVNGHILFIQVYLSRSCPRYNIYDIHWNLLPFDHKVKQTEDAIDKPECFDDMVTFCTEFYNKTKFEYVRIDLYELDNKIYFSEFTFTPDGCYGYFSLDYDKKLYDLIHK